METQRLAEVEKDIPGLGKDFAFKKFDQVIPGITLKLCVQNLSTFNQTQSLFQAVHQSMGHSEFTFKP